MTDYTKNASFTAKTGTAIIGADFDAEFDEIATSSASKEDKASKGVANGYCGLDASGLIDATDLPATAALTNAANVFTAAQTFSSTEPYALWYETDAAADEKYWRWVSAAGLYYLQTLTDGGVPTASPVILDRSGTTVTSITFAGTQINLNCTAAAVNGNLAVSGTFTFGGVAPLTASSALNASNINTGSIGAAYVPQAAVTQHQAALTIAESQISDGATLARVAANETISGTWTYSAIPVFSGQGAFPHFASSTQSGGAITVSTAAASGTPAAGDLWIQYTA